MCVTLNQIIIMFIVQYLGHPSRKYKHNVIYHLRFLVISANALKTRNKNYKSDKSEACVLRYIQAIQQPTPKGIYHIYFHFILNKKGKTLKLNFLEALEIIRLKYSGELLNDNLNILIIIIAPYYKQVNFFLEGSLKPDKVTLQ